MEIDKAVVRNLVSMRPIEAQPKHFNAERLVSEATEILANHSIHFNEHSAINLVSPLNHKDPLTFGCGSLYSYVTNKWIAEEKDFDTIIDQFANTYLADTINDVALYAKEKYNLEIGRSRLMILRPKSCLTFHTDTGATMRFHIPIITNQDCMFIHNVPHPIVSKMPTAGQLYTFDSSIPHTAINASREQRVHLVMVGY